jgi:hypothetical protein
MFVSEVILVEYEHCELLRFVILFLPSALDKDRPKGWALRSEFELIPDGGCSHDNIPRYGRVAERQQGTEREVLSSFCSYRELLNSGTGRDIRHVT